jgi:hypothetical protein
VVRWAKRCQQTQQQLSEHRPAQHTRSRATSLVTSSLNRVLFFKQSIKAVQVAEQSSTLPLM